MPRQPPLLIELARTLGEKDLSELTGDAFDAPVRMWGRDVHHVVPAIRNAMRDVSFGPPLDSTAAPTVDAVDLAARVRRLIP